VTHEEYEDSYRFVPQKRSWLVKNLRPIANFLGGAFMTVATLGYARLVTPFKTEYNQIEMPLRNLPASLENFRILQLTDFHTGGYMPIGHLRKVIAHVNTLPYDLAVVTGDLVSHSLKYVNEAAELVASLRRPVAVTFGNHDYSATIEPWSSHEVADALTKALEPRGVESGSSVSMTSGQARFLPKRPSPTSIRLSRLSLSPTTPTRSSRFADLGLNG
jgi:hypothetical protein